MELYLDSFPEFYGKAKEAAFAARLSDSPDNWAQEINSELFKQLPYLSDYAVNVHLDSVEPQRGFAFGYADITNKTERPVEEHADAGIPHARIPVIVIERALKPFLVFLDGDRVLPLNESRIRELLFNAQTFDMTSSTPVNPSLLESMTPPQRTGPGQGGEAKLAHVKQASILLEIAPTIRESDASAFIEKISNDHNLRAGFTRSGIAPILVEAIDKTKRASAEDRLTYIADHIKPTAITFHKLPGGDFLVKSANVQAFNANSAQGAVVPAEQAAQAMGPDNAQQMMPGQTATAVSEPVQEQPIYETNEKVIEEFGQYLVQDEMGNRIMGSVFPKTLSWDESMSVQPLALFTNGSVYAFQDVIAGELVGKVTAFPMDVPRGDGVFYFTENGKAMCTAPITIKSAVTGPDGMPKHIGNDSFGNEIHVVKAEGLKNPQRISDVEFAIPESWKFMRLNQQTHLVEDPVQMNKAAHARIATNSVELLYNGGFNLRGGCGLEKVSTSLRHDLDPVSTEFMLGVLGLSSQASKSKIAEARRHGVVKISGLKTIYTLSEKYKGAEKVASKLFKQIPDIRVDLIKEAAALEDTGTVDNILALNFINPENLMTFIQRVPELEMTSENLAEMWLFAVLGLKELPESAIERAMLNLEQTIQALKSVAHAEA